ncbi:MAG: class I SAM-dependent methyltransferase [Gemmatimonadota bacterium]|jgi:SAM-dependent methyltransferase
MDPLAGSNWSDPGTVTGFSRSPPNPVLMGFADTVAADGGGRRALDLGCGAGRNAVPLAQRGWSVLGTDLSWPMLTAAVERARAAGVSARSGWALAPMEQVPARADSFDLVVAHGIWNLAPSAHVFRAAVADAARVSRPGAALFVFTFSRNTLPEGAAPVANEPFVFTQFSGLPQCFLTYQELHEELAAVGFTPDPSVPVTEHNRPSPRARRVGGPPVIWECAFRLG